MKKALIPKLALALCLIGLGAFSLGADDHRVEEWLNADTNTDGKLSAAETSGLMKRFFGRNDTNKDGFLDRSELTDLDNRLKQREWKPKGNPDSLVQPATSGSVHFQADVAYREATKCGNSISLIPKKNRNLYVPELSSFMVVAGAP